MIRRAYPSANAVLLEGARPVLVDPGHAPDVSELLRALDGVRPALVFNTHAHSDHAGANRAFEMLGVPIAAGAGQAAAARARDPECGRAAWLDQPIQAYRVSRVVVPGEAIGTGDEQWDVVALPGHMPDQLGLHCAATGELVAGDALHETDLGWLDLDLDPDALEASAATLDLIERLAPALVLSGHGPAITDVTLALVRARRRLAAWRAEPEMVLWHAVKRIFAHKLLIEGGVVRDRVETLLLASPWFVSFAARFGDTPAGFVPRLLAAMVESGARWDEGRLVATAAGQPRAG